MMKYQCYKCKRDTEGGESFFYGGVAYKLCIACSIEKGVIEDFKLFLEEEEKYNIENPFP